jgi:hypothetical protein
MCWMSLSLGSAPGCCGSSVAMEPCARRAKCISPRGSPSTPPSQGCVDVRRSIFWRFGADAISLSIPRRRDPYPMSLESCLRSVRLRMARSRGVALMGTTDKTARTALAPMDALDHVCRFPHQHISQRTRQDISQRASRDISQGTRQQRRILGAAGSIHPPRDRFPVILVCPGAPRDQIARASQRVSQMERPAA